MSEPRIRVLSEDVANQIAAGEVVERPASVVKELAENAVDAGATRLLVELEDGGKRLIRVVDNGCGMSAEEAVLALQRHATSKISHADDLLAVRTLGFRGEALPSIASVSRLTIVTRPQGSVEGTRLEAAAGEIHRLDPVGAPEGTTISVEELFYNTPARLKFLKSTRAELGQVCEALTRIALSRNEVTVRLTHEGSDLLNVPASTELVNTAAAIYGKDVARDLLPVSWERPGIRVEGLVSRPTHTRPTRSAQSFFVNGRFVRNRTLTHALDDAFRATMPGGRFPVAILRIEVDPGVVDVNVHPTKSEVRFLREWEVHQAVSRAVKAALGQPVAAGAGEGLMRQTVLTPEQVQSGVWAPVPTQPTLVDPNDPFALPDEEAASRGAAAALLTSLPGDPHPASASPAQTTLPALVPPLGRLRAITQVWNSYLVAEGPTGLWIVDQHLAHERVLFDRLMREQGEPAVQRLALPITLQLTHREAVLIDESLADLQSLGFALEPFGRDAFMVRATPAFVRPGDELATLRGVIDQMLESRDEQRISLPRERVAATTACKAAVKKGSRLAFEEMERLLDDLCATDQPHTCPHGCPIVVEITYQELLRRFKRI